MIHEEDMRRLHAEQLAGPRVLTMGLIVGPLFWVIIGFGIYRLLH